jgi:antitoxin component YwqK of YwqJK toxin-antitoxin module
MKWYFYIFLLITFGCKQTIVVTEDAVSADILYSKGTYSPYTGKCVVLFNHSDRVKEEFRFKNGILHGQSQAWYKNGQLRRKGCYSHGRITGVWTFWDEQGNKVMEAGYRNDLLDGLYMALYSNGKIKEKGKYASNRKTGEWVYYNENGQVVKNSRN